MDPTLFTPHSSEDQAVLAKICGIDLPQAYIFNGYQRGPRASGIRCSVCGRLLGHGANVVAYKGIAHCRCYADRVKMGQLIVPRPSVTRHAEEMERQLRVHDAGKAEHGWTGLRNGYLWGSLANEVDDLHEALLNGDPEEIIHEAADVANIAMMIADNARSKGG